MKNTLKAATLIAVTGAMFTTTAQADSVDIPVKAEIVTALTLTKTADMDFGRATSPSGSTGTVTLDVTDTATGSNTTTSGTAASGEFTVLGNASTVNLTFPASVTMTNGTPAEDMTVTTFTHDYNGTDNVDTLRTIKVGGQLQLADGQATGSYTGTLQVTVNY